MAHYRQSPLAEERHANLVAVMLAGAQSGRAGLAISARHLSLQPRLRQLRGHHRRRLRRMAKTSRPDAADHLNQGVEMGP